MEKIIELKELNYWWDCYNNDKNKILNEWPCYCFTLGWKEKCDCNNGRSDHRRSISRSGT